MPTTPLCRAILDLVVSKVPTPVAHHSVRSFLFARSLARHHGADLDLELLFSACILHDVGLSSFGDRGQRFEIDGDDVAAEFLAAHGVARPGVDAVWDAIALHSSAQIAARRSALCAFTQAGAWDFSGAGTDAVVSYAQATEIHRAFPRTGMARALADVITQQAHGRPDKAPRYALADALVQERAAPGGLTRMEQDEPHSRWARFPIEASCPPPPDGHGT